MLWLEMPRIRSLTGNLEHIIVHVFITATSSLIDGFDLSPSSFCGGLDVYRLLLTALDIDLS